MSITAAYPARHVIPTPIQRRRWVDMRRRSIALMVGRPDRVALVAFVAYSVLAGGNAVGVSTVESSDVKILISMRRSPLVHLVPPGKPCLETFEVVIRPVGSECELSEAHRKVLLGVLCKNPAIVLGL